MAYNYHKTNCYLTQDRRQNSSFGYHKGVKDLNTHTGSSLHPGINGPGFSFDEVDEKLDSLTGSSSYGATPHSYITLLRTLNSDISAIAAPQTNNMAESMSGTNAGGNLQDWGKFDQWPLEYPNLYTPVGSAFPGLTPGCLWYAMSYWYILSGSHEYVGTVYLNFPQFEADGVRGLKDLFYPAMVRNTEAIVRHGSSAGDYTFKDQLTFNSGQSGTVFSSVQQPGEYGYHSTSKFSRDNGIWGYRSERLLDGEGRDGSQLYSTKVSLNESSSQNGLSFGFQNYRNTDTSANDLYWGFNHQLITNQTIRCIVWSVVT